MSEDKLVTFFRSIGNEKLNIKIQLEVVLLDIERGKLAIRTKYVDQFLFMRRTFLEKINSVMNIKTFDNLLSFYLLNLIDFNKILYFDNIEVLTQSNYMLNTVHLPRKYTHILCLPLMNDVIFNRLQLHIEEKKSNLDTEVYSICRPLLTNASVIYGEKSGSDLPGRQLKQVEINTKRRVDEYTSDKDKFENKNVEYIDKTGSIRLDEDITSPASSSSLTADTDDNWRNRTRFDSSAPRKDHRGHTVVKVKSPNGQWHGKKYGGTPPVSSETSSEAPVAPTETSSVAPPVAPTETSSETLPEVQTKETKQCESCKKECILPINILPIAIQLELKKYYDMNEPTKKFVLNVEKHFDGTNQRFVTSCRSKCLGGNGRFIPVIYEMDKFDHISLEKQIDVLIRETSEEWNLNFEYLKYLFSIEKITLIDRKHKIINILSNEIKIFKDKNEITKPYSSPESRLFDSFDRRTSLFDAESYKDDEFLFVCKFDIGEDDLIELFKPNKEVPKTIGGKQYRSYWRHMLTDIFKL